MCVSWNSIPQNPSPSTPGCHYLTLTSTRNLKSMAVLPKIGTMIRCIGPNFDAGSVTYAGHSIIQLPRRTERQARSFRGGGGGFADYQLKRIGEEWVYELVI